MAAEAASIVRRCQLLLLILLLLALLLPDASWQYDIEFLNKVKKPTTLPRDKVLLIVNVASHCGYTKQYAGLQALEAELGPRGFAVVGFPCNQFAGQEPGDGEDISACARKFDAQFAVHDKIEVNGSGEHPLYAHMKREGPSGALGTKMIKWNFSKFIVDAAGETVARHGSTTTPEDLREEILAMLPAEA